VAQTVELELDEQTVARARQAAAARGQTLEAFLAELVRQAGWPADNRARAALGGAADDEELIDRTAGSAVGLRGRHSLAGAAKPHISRMPSQAERDDRDLLWAEEVAAAAGA
jgi:hypothetical protein